MCNYLYINIYPYIGYRYYKICLLKLSQAFVHIKYSTIITMSRLNLAYLAARSGTNRNDTTLPIHCDSSFLKCYFHFICIQNNLKSKEHVFIVDYHYLY